MSLADELRDNAREWDISECPQRAEIARRAAGRIEELEAEIHRLRYFASVIDEHAENIKTEAAIALRPQHVDIVKDGSIGHATGHGPTDPPRPVQRHDGATP